MVCQVCGAKSGIYPLCASDYKKYKMGDLVKCPTCSMFHLKEDDCPRCSRSLLLGDLLIKKNEMKYWGTKLFAIAKKGKQQNREGRDRQRYESVIEISTGMQPFWADPEKPMTTVSKKQMFAWSEALNSVANEGREQSDGNRDITRYSDIIRLSDEMQAETASYFDQPQESAETRAASPNVEFLRDRDIESRLLLMIREADRKIRIASPWVGSIHAIIKELEEVMVERNVHVDVIVRPPERDRYSSPEKTVKNLRKKGVSFELEPLLHAKMVVVDSKEAYIGSANLTARSMGQNLEVGICTKDPEVISRAIAYFDDVLQAAFDRRLKQTARTDYRS